MDKEELIASDKGELEDGEVTDSSIDDGYTPLQRPTATADGIGNKMKAFGMEHSGAEATIDKKKQCVKAVSDDNDQPDLTSSSDGGTSTGETSSEDCIKKESSRRKLKKGHHRTVMVRVQEADEDTQQKRARFKKYNVWMSALHEELTENMRGCDVTQKSISDRNVENYDFSLRDRLIKDNSLKRHLSNSTDDYSDSDMQPASKRERRLASDGVSNPRRCVKSRLGHYKSSGNDNAFDVPRYILDLNNVEGQDFVELGKEIATKLNEQNDDILIRILEILGKELPIEIYKETQRIEASGGMMIMDGTRRRTPGGVFLFLLKNHKNLSPEEHKSIFNEKLQNINKNVTSVSRDRKVEELKKRLNEQDTVLPALNTRKESLLGSNLNAESKLSNLSNPPPSPVGQEHSPEYKSSTINHIILDTNLEKPSTSQALSKELESPSKILINYEDDFLDMNCGDMDFS